MNPEQIQRLMTKIAEMADRQEALAGRQHEMLAMLTAGMIALVLILVVNAVSLLIKVSVYRRMATLLEATRVEAEAAHNLLKLSKEYARQTP